MVRGYCGRLFGLVGTQLGLAMYTSSVNLPTHPLILEIHNIAGSVQKISQNQPVQPVAIYISDVSIITAIFYPT